MTVISTLIRQAGTPYEQRFLDLYSDVADRLPGADVAAVRQWRETSIDAFASLGLPHRRVEEYKYTDLRVLMPEVLPLSGLSATAPGIALEAAIGTELAGLDAYRAVFVNGTYNAELSSVAEAPGIDFLPARAMLSNEDVAAARLSELGGRDGDAIFALASAFATDGALVSVAPGAKLDKPLHLIFVSAGNSPTLKATQSAIRVGAGAEVTLIETHAALLPGQSFQALRLVIGADASVKHTRLTQGKGGKHLASFGVELASGAQYDPVFLAVDGALTRVQGAIRFNGDGGRAHFTGGMLLRGQDHGDMTLVVDHAVPHCESRELVKVVLDGRARGVFQAKVLVRKDAQKTDGKQMSNALLLSDEAEFDAKPELEIYADDVVCGHGATAGQLDGDLMFYLRARGIPEAEARALLIAAFIREALDKIEHEALREALDARVQAWLLAAK